jgi:ADP-ribose pyrophosphatase YjhB (NUDIX family)
MSTRPIPNAPRLRLTNCSTTRQADLTDITHRSACVVLDFDGTLTPDPEMPWKYVAADVDAGLIRECWAAGCAVAVSTCADVDQVADVLERCGIPCTVDHSMTRWTWHEAGRVLISNRKLSGAKFLDDKAMHWWHGRDHRVLFAELERRHGYHDCPGGHHHWGPDGAAGVLPYAEHEGRLWVALGRRSAMVQGGESWSTFGGAGEAGETALEAGLREAREECHGLGHLSPGAQYVAPCARGCGWSYVTTVARAGTQRLGCDQGHDGGSHTLDCHPRMTSGLPDISVRRGPHQWETTAAAWWPADELGDLPDLHPGLRDALPELLAMIRLDMIPCG